MVAQTGSMKPWRKVKETATYKSASLISEHSYSLTGMGFKSEEDKQAYLASLGDPLEHPLFAQSAEDCKGIFLCVSGCN